MSENYPKLMEDINIQIKIIPSVSNETKKNKNFMTKKKIYNKGE